MPKPKTNEPDSLYFLKILMFFLIGSIWVRFVHFNPLPGINSLPVGLIVGLIFASHDHFQIDRKIEYLVLLIAALLSFIAPIGLVAEF
jgi:ethanolamine transporter EutH